MLIEPLGKTYFVTCLQAESQTGRKITKGAGNTLSFVLTNDDISKAYVYPNPIKSNETDIIYFANLPLRAKVEIYDLSTNLIKTLYENDGNGGVKWDLTDNNSNRLNTGIYFFKVFKLENEKIIAESDLKKFAIVK